MSREVCKHGVELKYSEDRTAAWHPCNECIMENAPWSQPEFEERQRKERRAEWIRNNAPHFYGVDAAVDMAEKMADELIKRGYL